MSGFILSGHGFHKTMKARKPEITSPKHVSKNEPLQVQEVWGYCRVSTTEQDNKRQEHEILTYANERRLTVSRFVRSSVSSRKDETERGIDVLRSAAENGAIGSVIFSELSRLGRSVGEIARLVAFFTSHNVTLVFLKESMTLGPSRNGDITSKVTLTIFSLLAEIERDLISERTKSALAVRKAAGVQLGRPSGKSKLDHHEPQIRQWVDLGVTQKAIARHLNCTDTTVSLWLSRNREKWATNTAA